MERNIYCLRDIISHNVVMIGDASTDGEFVRNVFPSLRAAGRNLDDLQYFQIASYDVESMAVIPCSARLGKNDAYKFPEVHSRQLTAEEIQKLAAQLAAVKK